MDFMRLLKSVEELLYELVTWILFYPLTFWRCIRHPIEMMEYAVSELSDEGGGRYDKALSPPIFLLITLFIPQLIEARFDVESKAHLPEILQSDQNLLFFRAICFSLFPLILALQQLRQHGTQLTRQTLKPPFYSQSYVAAPFVLSLMVAVIIGQHGTPLHLWAGTALFALGLGWYLGVEVCWVMKRRGMSAARAVLTVVPMMLLGFVVVLAVLVATALMIIA